MTDYYRVNFKQEFREQMEEFIDDHPEYAFDNPKELMKHATREFMMRNKQTLTKEEVMQYFEERIFDD